MHPGHHRRNPEGKKELVGFTDGMRESAESWRELLLDLRRRGLSVAPELAVADGALGFWKALGEVWPTTREQRCWVHKTALAMIYKLAQAAEKSWHRLRGHNHLPKVILSVKFNDGIEVVKSQARAAAA